MRKRLSTVLFGILVILLGIGLLGQAIDWWDFVGFTGWWTLFIIIPAVFLIVSYGIRFWNMLMLCVGVLLLLKEQDIITQGMFFPIILAGLVITLGVRIAFGSHYSTVKSVPGFTNTPPTFYGQPDYSPTFNYDVVFGSIRVKNVCQDLLSGKISSVFGSVEVDLAEIRVSRDIVIESSAAFGGVKIYAPRTCRVKVESSSAFGGCDNRAATLTDQTLPLVTIKVSNAFGGTEVL